VEDLSLDASVQVTGVKVPGVTGLRDSQVSITSKVRASGRVVTSHVTSVKKQADPTSGGGGRSAAGAKSALAGRSAAQVAGSRSVVRTGTGVKDSSLAVVKAASGVTSSPCAVAPMDPGTQVVQPTNAQVEWAAHRAVRGLLTTARPAGWHKNGLAAYTPSTMFPRPGLSGYPSAHIPAQILLGVMAQESNLSQASWHAWTVPA
jgi:hypothetical protein